MKNKFENISNEKSFFQGHPFLSLLEFRRKYKFGALFKPTTVNTQLAKTSVIGSNYSGQFKLK